MRGNGQLPRAQSCGRVLHLILDVGGLWDACLMSGRDRQFALKEESLLDFGDEVAQRRGPELVLSRRATGSYYTPKDAAHYMAKWLVRRSNEKYLEPSFGSGVFISAVNDEVTRRGYEPASWLAVELQDRVARETASRGTLDGSQIVTGDFMSVAPVPVDAVIANPPFVRISKLAVDGQSVALDVGTAAMGRRISPGASLWMPFVAHAMGFVRHGGRMAFVLPLDFAYVRYAVPLWLHLGKSFASLKVIRVRQRIFSDINQDVMILLADNKGGATAHVEFEAFDTAEGLVQDSPSVSAQISIQDIAEEKRPFQSALLPPGLDSLLTALPENSVSEARDMMKFRIGYVSGDKRFFHPDDATITEYELPAANLRPSVINARRLKGQGLRTSSFGGGVANQLWLPSEPLTEGERGYAKLGEASEVDRGYKASRRQPWYRVPGVETPDVVLTVFSERPLLLINDAGWAASNSLICGFSTGTSADEFANLWYSPLTLLSVGLQVHSLGGGVMVMVPGEAGRIMMLRKSDRPRHEEKLRSALALGDLEAAYETGARAVEDLVGRDGLDLVRRGIESLRYWRIREPTAAARVPSLKMS